MFSSKNFESTYAKKCVIFEIIRQVLENHSAPIRSRWPWQLEALPPNLCVVIYSFHYKTLWICTKFIAIKCQF